MDEPRRYTFNPLERRGVMLGMELSQVLTIVGGVLLATVAVPVLGGGARLVAVAACLGGPVMAALVPIGGRPFVTWAPVGSAWLVRGAARRRLSECPGTGRHVPQSATTPDEAFRKARKGAIPGVSVSALPAQPGSTEVGVISDARHRSLCAVVPVRGRSFSLLDPSEQVQRLESWRAVLGAMGRPGSPLRRVQWIERSAPTDRLATLDVPSGPGAPDSLEGRAQESYQNLLRTADPRAQVRDVWLILSVASAWPNRIRQDPKPAETLQRELRLLEGHLRSADLRAARPMEATELSRLVDDPPMAIAEEWSRLRVDGSWHVTYWVSDWPRVDVSPDFLTPLLLGPGRRTVAVVMSPVPTTKAVREARSARTADLADAEIRSRAGFLPSARRDREADGAVRRESELADGHCEFRFSGYVTVAAADENSLETACAEAEHSAQASRLELRRLYGRQLEAYTWTLPMARGLA